MGLERGKGLPMSPVHDTQHFTNQAHGPGCTEGPLCEAIWIAEGQASIRSHLCPLPPPKQSTLTTETETQNSSSVVKLSIFAHSRF